MGYETIVLKPFAEKFCWEYLLRRLNGKRAYMALKPRVTERTAEVESSKLLRKPEIINRISQIRREKIEKKMEEAVLEVLDQHLLVLRTDRTELLRLVKNCQSTDDLTKLDDDYRAVLEFEQVSAKDGVRTLIKVPKRHESLVELAKITGMHKNQVELTGKDGAPLGNDGGISDIERASRLVAILDAARARRDGQDSAGGDAQVGAAPGPAE